MPGQLVFGLRSAKAHKQQIIHKNNWIENSKWIPHHYQVGDLVMLENDRANKYEQPYSGPYALHNTS
jgi:hypothetical protein